MVFIQEERKPDLHPRAFKKWTYNQTTISDDLGPRVIILNRLSPTTVFRRKAIIAVKWNTCRPAVVHKILLVKAFWGLYSNDRVSTQ